MPPIEWPASTARSCGASVASSTAVEVGGKEFEAVAAAPRDAASAVAAMVEGDHPVVGGQVGDLVGPHPDRARDAVRQHDRIAVGGPEHLGVQGGAVAARTVRAAARR